MCGDDHSRQLILSSTGTNPIVKLAEETRTPIHRWNQKTIIIDHEGNPVPSVRVEHALSTVWRILENALNYSKTNTANIPIHKSLFHYFMTECASMVKRQIITPDDSQLILSMSEMWGAYIGAEVGSQSLRFFYLEDCIEDSKLRSPRLLTQCSLIR